MKESLNKIAHAFDYILNNMININLASFGLSSTVFLIFFTFPN